MSSDAPPPTWSRWAFYLAVETSTPLGSVALARGNEVLARRFLLDRGAHASGIIPAIKDVLDESQVDQEELAGLVVGGGPGSFTGVRVAASTVKGFAYSLGLPLWAFSSLAAAAVTGECLPYVVNGPDYLQGAAPLPVELEELPRYVLFDARGDRVYAGSYSRLGTRLEEVDPPEATTIGALIRKDPSPETLFMGDGAIHHLETLYQAGHTVLTTPWGVPTADGLLHLFSNEPGAVPLENPGRWEPEYLKPSSAERLRLA